jgi:hypothetical protein
MKVEWGKHNPAESRLVHSVLSTTKHVTNTLSVLPVVAIRHPLTWMVAMCKHSTGTLCENEIIVGHHSDDVD